MEVKKISQDAWKPMAKDAHVAVFSENWKEDFERLDYALLMVNETDDIVAYATIREPDNESVYIQYGGSVPKYRATRQAYQAWVTMIEWFKHSGYKRVGFMTKNTNQAMLKFGMKSGFTIIGMRYFANQLLLEHEKEF